MPTDPEIESILKSREPKTDAAKNTAATAPVPAMDWQQSMGEGVAKEFAGLATGAADVVGAGAKQVGRLLPEEYGKRMNEFVDRDLSDPTFQRMRNFARTPGSNWWSTAGTGLTDLALMAFGPGEAKVATQVPQWTSRGFQTLGPARTAPSVVQRGIRAAEQGAYGGVITDPNDPLKGAAAGAVAGPAVAGLGAAAGTEAGQFALGHGTVGAIAAHGLHRLGMPLHEALPFVSSIQGPIAWALLHYRNSPVARAINDWAMSLGDIAARHASQAAIPAGEAAGVATRHFSPPPTVTVPRRAEPTEPMMREPPPERKKSEPPQARDRTPLPSRAVKTERY